MSCLPDGFEVLCGHDENIAMRQIEETAKAAIGNLLASMKHSRDNASCGVESEELVRDRSIFVSDSEDDGTKVVETAVALHRQELALIEEGLDGGSVMHDDSTVIVHHVDEKSKTKTRAQELEELRQRSLASQKAVKINSTDSEVPTDMDTFQRRQRALHEEQRKNQKLARDGLHAYRADDKQVLEEMKRTALLKGYHNHQNDLSTPFFSTMTDFGNFEKLQKEIAEWKNKRSGDDPTFELNDEQQVAYVSEKFQVDVALIQAIFDAERTVKEETTTPLRESPGSSSTRNDCCVTQNLDCVESLTQTLQFDPESLFAHKTEEDVHEEKKMQQPTDSSDLCTVELALHACNNMVTTEFSLEIFDEVASSVKRPLKRPPTTSIAASTPEIFMSKTPEAPGDSFEEAQRRLFAEEEKQPVVLKNVPLYGRKPSIEIRSTPPSRGKGIITCSSKYVPNLHVKRDACERCLYWASPEEKARFVESGHHLRIMMVRGGCGNDCSVFPRKADEYPVRLCKKCYFDTHKLSNEFCSQEELRLLWSNSYEKLNPKDRKP